MHNYNYNYLALELPEFPSVLWVFMKKYAKIIYRCLYSKRNEETIRFSTEANQKEVKLINDTLSYNQVSKIKSPEF